MLTILKINTDKLESLKLQIFGGTQNQHYGQISDNVTNQIQLKVENHIGRRTVATDNNIWDQLNQELV